MDNFVLLVRLTIRGNKAEIFSYSAGFSELTKTEKDFCHHYVVTSDDPIIGINTDDYSDSSSVYISFDEKKVYLWNDWTGSEATLSYASIETLDPPVEIVLSAKIKFLLELYESEHRSSINFHQRLDEVQKYIEKTIDSGSRKLSFFIEEKNQDKLNETQGRLKLAEEIDGMLKRKFS